MYAVWSIASAEAVKAQMGSMRATVPSPTAATLGKFGDVPVSLHTGTADISIPLFTVKGRTLDVPITLRYDGRGIRVEEVGGWAGMGWTLEAGGAVTRTVRGLVDESSNGYYHTGHTWYSGSNWTSPSYALIQNVQNGTVDGEPDRFFFNMAGRSGQFVMGPTTTSPSQRKVRTVPRQNVRIVPVFTGYAITGWKVTDEAGTTYTFSHGELTQDHTILDVSGGSSVYPTEPAHYSSWQLSKIRSAGGDSIMFYYSPYSVYHHQGRYKERHELSVGLCSEVDIEGTNVYQTAAQRLDSIKSATHTVKFATTLRTDARHPITNAQQEPRLDSIMVNTPSGTPVRRFLLDYDYYAGNRLRLKAVYERDGSGASLPPHTFTYDSQTLPARSSYAQDHWGYYNGKNSNATLLPALVVDSLGISLSGADRNPSGTHMKAGVLTRITYPTGGYSEFVYEPNDYGAVGSGAEVPISLSPTKWTSVYAFPYEADTVHFTVGGLSPVQATLDVWTDQECPPGHYECPYVMVPGVGSWDDTGTYTAVLPPGNYMAIAYSKDVDATAVLDISWRELIEVKKKMGGGLRIAEVKTADAMGSVSTRRYRYTLESDTSRSSGIVQAEPRYHYLFSTGSCAYLSRSSVSKMPLGEGPPVAYREVTVWHGANAEYGRTRHTFRSITDTPDDDPPPADVWPFSPSTSYAWARGQQKGASEYNPSGQVQNRKASIHTLREAPADSATEFLAMAINVFSSVGSSTYVYHNFKITSAWVQVQGDSTFMHNETGGGAFSTATTYVHANPVHMQPTQVTETNSDGVQRITRTKYPADYASGGSGTEAIAITGMKDTLIHIHAPVIERWVTQKVGSTERVIHAELMTFKKYSGATQYLPYQMFVLNDTAAVSGFAPSTVSGSFQKDSRYMLQETANTYDAFGRVTQLADARSKLTNYQYGHTGNAFLTKVTRVKDGTGSIDLVTDLTYDAAGNVASIKDEAGTFQYFTHDGFGRLRQIKNHANAVVKGFAYTYSRTSGNGWTYQTSTPNLVLDTTYLRHSPSVARVVTRQFLDGLGRPIQSSVQDGSNYHVTAQQYDSAGRDWRTWRPYTRTSSAYDASFLTNATAFYNTYLGVSNAKPYTETQYRPDALNRPMKIIPEFTGTTATAFKLLSYGTDAGAKQSYVETTDEGGNKTRSYTDAFGNEVKTVRGSHMGTPSTTALGYNVMGQRTQVTDPRGLSITYGMSTRGLLGRRTSPDAGTQRSKHDAAGNLRFSQDAVQAAAGKVLFTNYDFGGRPLVSGLGTATFSSLNPDAAPGTLETTNGNWHTVRKYDAKPTNVVPWSHFWTQISPLTLSNVAGRLSAVASRSNGAWQVTLYSYDTDGRVATTHTFTQANGGGSVLTALNTTTTYERDLRGEVTKRSVTVGSNPFHQWYDYDNRGLLWKVFASTSSTKPGSADVTYTFRPDGAPATRQYLGDASIDFAYTIRGQLGRIGSLTSTTVPFAALYTYNPNGTMQYAEFRSNGSPHANKRYRYAPSHDGKNQLTAAQYAYHNGSNYTNSNAWRLTGIGYDLSGNLTTLQRYRGAASLIDNLTYSTAGSSNRLGSIADAIGSTAEDWDVQTGSFTYDQSGNMKTAPAPYGITAVTYDHMNLPLSITGNGTTSTYRYNGEAQRIAKQVGSGNTDVYIQEGPLTLGVFSVNGSGTPLSWHFNIVAGDRVVGRQPSGGAAKRYYHRDLLGSTRAVVQNGTIVESYDYDPWGVLMAGRTLAGPTREGFTGKERDETGLDYFGFRYYMSAAGRWTSVDPLSGQFPSWSSYTYATNSPIAILDRYGLCAVDADGIDYTYDICGNVVDQTENGLEQDRHFVNIEGEKLLLDYQLLTGDTPYEVYDEAVFDNLAISLAHQLPDVGGHDVGDYIRRNFLASSEGGTLDTKHQMPERALWKTGNGNAVHRDKVGNAVWAHYYMHRRYPLVVLLLGAKLQGKFATPSGREDPLDQVYIRRGYSIKP